MDIRVRFAPSPTGFFSLGNARTALYNWIFARSKGGKFLVRIEDTDRERSEKTYEDDVLEQLRWLGLDWDEEPIRDSERLEVHEGYLKTLLAEKKAYWCFCSSEDLETEYQQQLASGIQPKYSGRCRGISIEDANARVAAGEKATIRFRMPEKKISFHDLIRGTVEFDTALFGDIIIAKGFRDPLYNFSVVVDDFDTKITHVIRGEDHLSNTPKQIAIQEALGFPTLEYGHLPFILGADKKKLSKRFGGASIREYRAQGYLPEPLVNFLTLLGWHPEKDREVLTRKEIIEEFSFDRVQKGGAVFNPEKLDWLSGQYLRTLPVSELTELLKPFVPAGWADRKEVFEHAIPLVRDRISKLADFIEHAQFFFDAPEYLPELLRWKTMEAPAAKASLEAVEAALKNLNEFSQESVLGMLSNLGEKQGRGETFWPFRVALSGRQASPGPSEIAGAIGKTETLARIATAIAKLS